MPSDAFTTFGGLRIGYDDTMLVPRDWTRAQSEWAAELLEDAPPGPVLELCAGAGHIGLLAVATGARQLVAVEVNPAACAHLRRNADAAGLPDVDVRQATIAEALRPDERFALVIADPPWVPCGEVDRFPDDPVGTIDGGADGLAIARECLAVIAGHLLPGGAAILQLGNPDQVAALAPDLVAGSLALAEQRGYDRGILVHLAPC